MIYILAEAGTKKISLFLKNRITKEQFQRYSFVLDYQTTEMDIEQIELEINQKFLHHNLIVNLTSDNNIARTCIELAAFAYLCPFSEDVLGFIIPNHPNGTSLKLSMLISQKNNSMDTHKLTNTYLLISKILIAQNLYTDQLETCFYFDFTLAAFFNNQYVPSKKIEKYVSFQDNNHTFDNMILWENESSQLSEKIENVSTAIAVIGGEALSGRRFFAEYTAKKCGFPTYIVDFDFFFLEQNHEILHKNILHIIRDCFILGAALCISNISQNNHPEKHKIISIINTIIEEFSFSSKPIFITTDNSSFIIPLLPFVSFCFDIPRLDPKQSMKVWRFFGSNYTDILYENIADRIILPVGKIKLAVLRYSFEINENNCFNLAEFCYSLIDNSKQNGIKRICPVYTWDDIKLEELQKNTLHQICNHVKYKNTIMTDWNMHKLYPYGNSISALFTGAPGTGKTMAAHVIAKSLNMPLFQVDLSRIFDKYIGETEKKLEEVFATAEKSNVILFFDEADALFGKRSNINNSNDKYANNEMSYILQRMESFDGIVLMATNFSNNIDNAFMRRIMYVVDFQLPDKNLRNQIWRSFFNDNLPHDEIDFDFLSSDRFAFSGASIKNIMMNAMVKALSAQKPLQMEHIILAIKEEYQKMGVHSFLIDPY